MKIKLALLLFIFIIYGLSFCEDLVPQKVGIMVDRNSENYSIDLILQKSILSGADGLKNIYIFPGDKEDLEITGIKELNVNLLLLTEFKDGFYTVNFYDADNKPVLMGDSIVFPKDNLTGYIDNVSRLILSNLIKQYPEKPKKELKTIETIKIKLSEFESLKPSYSIRIIPNFISINQIELRIKYNSSDGNNYDNDMKLSGNPMSAIAELLFKYRQWNLNAGFGGSTDTGTTLPSYSSTIYGGFGYGLFGSLIILGANAYYQNANFKNKTNTTISYSDYGTNHSNSINIPDVTYQAFLIALTLQLNITKDYYIMVTGAFPTIWNSVSFDFKDTANSAPSGFSLNSSSGPPYIDILFNFTIFKKWKLLLDYSFMSAAFNSDDQGNNGQPKPADIGNNFYLRNFSINQIHLGAGLEYEF